MLLGCLISPVLRILLVTYRYFTVLVMNHKGQICKSESMDHPIVEEPHDPSPVNLAEVCRVPLCRRVLELLVPATDSRVVYWLWCFRLGLRL